MADNIVRKIAPFINDRFLITSHWWYERVNPVTGVTQIHRGLDIATSGSKPLYSMLNGKVLSKYTDNAGALTLVIVDDNPLSQTYGYATLYTHLASYEFGINVNTRVSIGQKVGMEGMTGQATGIHLHLEMQDVSRFNWQWHWSYIKSDYIDPTEFMGIDNVDNTWWIYDGTPVPPAPTILRKKNFPWVLYSKRFRKRVNV